MLKVATKVETPKMHSSITNTRAPTQFIYVSCYYHTSIERLQMLFHTTSTSYPSVTKTLPPLHFLTVPYSSSIQRRYRSVAREIGGLEVDPSLSSSTSSGLIKPLPGLAPYQLLRYQVYASLTPSLFPAILRLLSIWASFLTYLEFIYYFGSCSGIPYMNVIGIFV